MLNQLKLICFVATTKPAEAKAFYGDTLGLSLVEESPFALIFDANRTMLRVQKVRELSPAAFTTLGWKVGDIHSTIRQLSTKGVRFERYDGLPQDELGVWTTPDGSKVAWFKDPDKNILSLTEFWKKPRKADKAILPRA
jgi:catechol 2,3-dioxygenase-like lactoylglutathione lyase family enzyme